MDARLFVNLKDRDLRREGLLVAEGRLLAERLLRSGRPVLGVVCSPRFAGTFRALAEGVCPLEVLPESEIAAIAGFAFHRGVLAVAPRPELPSLEALLASEGMRWVGTPSTLVACPDIANAENLGSVIRNAGALGAHGVLLGPRSSDPWSRRALKVAMGATFSIPLADCVDESRACRTLHDAGFAVATATVSASAVPLADYRRPARLCLVLGNEASGVGEPWHSCRDVEITIPMSRGTDSLNVAVAAGIFLHALRD